MNEIVIASIAGGIATLGSVLFAWWIRSGILQRVDTMEDKKASQEKVNMIEDEVKKKVDASLCSLTQTHILEKLNSIEDSFGGYMTKVDQRLDEGNKVMTDLKLEIVSLKKSNKEGN